VNELSVCSADLVNREDLVQRGEAVLASNEQRGERGYGPDPSRKPSPSRRAALCHGRNQSTRGASPQAPGALLGRPGRVSSSSRSRSA
jgi:hypothetical protein